MISSLFNYIAPCVNGSVRLAYPNDYYYGQVLVCIGGVWGSICRNEYWNHTDASVLCKQLGFSPYGRLPCHFNLFYIILFIIIKVL